MLYSVVIDIPVLANVLEGQKNEHIIKRNYEWTTHYVSMEKILWAFFLRRKCATKQNMDVKRVG